jgi:aspartyl-tRNA(Asn)/glutamyl-tRNA(Gln) amidotransferase subunit C
MTLNIEEVEHIAELARLQLSPEEKALYREQLSDILEYAARLQNVETAGVQPTASVSLSRGALREDIPKSGLSPKSLLGNAPQTTEGQFRVPPVLE